MSKPLEQQRLLVLADTSKITASNGTFTRIGLFFDAAAANVAHVDSHSLAKSMAYVESLFGEVVFARRDREVDGNSVPDFRFTAESLSDIDQVWCFGHAPTNRDFYDQGCADLANPQRLRELIASSDASPLEDAEIIAVNNWLNTEDKGLFATGDHFVAGASMGSRLPRVGAMRKWTGDQQAPTAHGFDALCTLVPPNNHPADLVISADAQSDEFAQLITPVVIPPHTRPHYIVREVYPDGSDIPYPEAFLLPDHMHEGGIFEDRYVDAEEQISLEDGTTIPHFPSAGGQRPLPTVIARGKVTGYPGKFEFINLAGVSQQGYFTERSVPVISVYDGFPLQSGRAVVDSTWHHWVDRNIDELLRHDAGDFIKAYYTRLAEWLGHLV